MLAMVATALAAIAETAYVGSMGTAALAGMALVFPLMMLQAMLSAGAMGGGVSSAVRRAFGAGQPERASALGAAFLLFWLLSCRAKVQLKLRSTPLQWPLARDILRVGAVACLSPLQTVLTILILTRLVAHFGTDALAGYGIGTRLEFLLVPIAFAVGVASVPLVGMAIGAGKVARARRAAWTAAALAAGLLGVIGLVVALAPGLWTERFTQDLAVIASAALYFQWVGPAYGLFGLGLCLYFSSLGAGKAFGPVLAGTLRLVVVAVGGAALAWAGTAPWTIFALVALGMAAYGLATVLVVRHTSWGEER